jgi:hypothetical protein
MLQNEFLTISLPRRPTSTHLLQISRLLSAPPSAVTAPGAAEPAISLFLSRPRKIYINFHRTTLPAVFLLRSSDRTNLISLAKELRHLAVNIFATRQVTLPQGRESPYLNSAHDPSACRRSSTSSAINCITPYPCRQGLMRP